MKNNKQTEERPPLTRSLNKRMKDVKSTEWPMKVQDERNCRLTYVQSRLFLHREPCKTQGERLRIQMTKEGIVNHRIKVRGKSITSISQSTTLDSQVLTPQANNIEVQVIIKYAEIAKVEGIRAPEKRLYILTFRVSWLTAACSLQIKVQLFTRCNKPNKDTLNSQSRICKL